MLSALLGFQIPGLPSYALWHIIELLFVIWIILLVLRWSFFPWHMHRGMRDGNATRILRRRYAKGEISETQYRKMMKTLSEKS
ncbi:MAG: SHOCT domain-containing protein [Candidatus Micrarchaeaceae archaeon]